MAKKDEKVVCEACNGTGLENADKLCAVCEGSGQVSK